MLLHKATDNAIEEIKSSIRLVKFDLESFVFCFYGKMFKSSRKATGMKFPNLNTELFLTE